MPLLRTLCLVCWCTILLSLPSFTPVSAHRKRGLMAKPRVKILPDEFRHASTSKDIELLFRTGLDFDIAMNRDKSKKWKLRGLAETILAHKELFKWWDHVNIGVIKNNRMFVAGTVGDNTVLPGASHGRIEGLLKEFHLHVRKYDMKFEDSIFILNSWDEPVCHVKRPEMCHAPIFSLIKDWDPATNTSQHSDILIPFFNHNCETISRFPWELKKPVAVMRAGIQASMPDNCTRLTLHKMFQKDQSLQKTLDIGLTSNRKRHLTLDLVPQVNMTDHAKWKYLIATDGVTATCRLCKLLGIDSVILKEVSPWVEYYGRPLKPDVNFVMFTAKNITQVVKQLESTPKPKLQKMIKTNMEYQQMYTTYRAKVLYFQKAIQEYNTLFPGDAVKDFVRTLDDSRLTNWEYLMEELMLSYKKGW